MSEESHDYLSDMLSKIVKKKDYDSDDYTRDDQKERILEPATEVQTDLFSSESQTSPVIPVRIERKLGELSKISETEIFENPELVDEDLTEFQPLLQVTADRKRTEPQRRARDLTIRLNYYANKLGEIMPYPLKIKDTNSIDSKRRQKTFILEQIREVHGTLESLINDWRAYFGFMNKKPLKNIEDLDKIIFSFGLFDAQMTLNNLHMVVTDYRRSIQNYDITQMSLLKKLIGRWHEFVIVVREVDISVPTLRVSIYVSNAAVTFRIFAYRGV